MLFSLARGLADQFTVANLFRYITFRAGAACLTALILSLVLGPVVIRWLRSVQRGGQPIRADGPARHVIEKKGTPTMGGVLILLSLTISTLLWTDLRNGYVSILEPERLRMICEFTPMTAAADPPPHLGERAVLRQRV